MLPQRVHEQQKFALMEATVKAVAKEGVENFTTKTIGELSEVKEVYIYRYFENKEDMVAKTFTLVDEGFLEYILENFPVINYESMDYEMRCHVLFSKCWRYIMERPDCLLFYVRYYYSLSFQKYSYEDHMKRYDVLIEKLKPACHKDDEVKTVLHHILDTILGQARKQIMHPRDANRAEEDAFWLVYSVLKCGKGV